MDRTESEINIAFSELNLTSSLFSKCDETIAKNVIAKTKATFVEGNDPNWWWFRLKHVITIKQFADGGFRHLLDYVPSPEEAFWFIPDIYEKYPLVYEARLPSLMDVLSECSAFVYYLVGKQFDWLIAEDDSDNLLISVPRALEATFEDSARL